MKRLAVILLASLSLLGCAAESRNLPVRVENNVPSECLSALSSADHIETLNSEFANAWLYMNKTADLEGTTAKVNAINDQLEKEVSFYITNRDACRNKNKS